MKKCQVCQETKDDTEFDLKRGKRRTQCSACRRQYARDWYQKNKEDQQRKKLREKAVRVKELKNKIRLYLSEHPCVDCYETDPIILEFDHVRGKKEYNLSTMIMSGYSWSSILLELAKCDVRCCNCHRRKTSKERNWWREK